MLSRILVAIVGIPLLVWILLNGGFPLFVFTEVVVLIGAHEFFKMSEIGGKKPSKVIGMGLAFLIPLAVYLEQAGIVNIGTEAVTALGIIVVMSLRVIQNRVEDASTDIGETLLGALYPAILFSHCILISYLPNGGKWLLTAQIMVWVCDSFAYFVGMAIGRKIFNRGFNSISPKKSIEGSIGGTLATIIALAIADRYFGLTQGGMNLITVVLFGIFISAVAQIGDLGESMYKREFKVKDSGTILRGHGGILDRFDSMLFVAPVMYYLLKFIIL